MSNLWIIKDALGQIQGPFETSEILIQIKNSVLSGDEKIASYPEGIWKEISAEPEFFDYMLEILSGSAAASEGMSSKNRESGIDESDETIQIEPNEGAVLQGQNAEEVQISDLLSEAEPIFPDAASDSPEGSSFGQTFESHVEDGDHDEASVAAPIQHREAKGRSHLFEDRQALTVDHLSSLKARSEKAQKTRKLLYLIAVVVVGLVGSLFLVGDGGDAKGRKTAEYRFVLPEKSRTLIKDTASRDRAVKRAAKLIQTDLVLNVMKAQRLLNQILSYEPRNKTSLLLLCGSYLRLWDYTGQTGSDLYVVSEISKRAYGIGSGGDVLYVCRLTEMILRGKTEEANATVDMYLNSEGFTGEASFYLKYFKGRLLFKKRIYSPAASFLEGSVALQPHWIPSLMLLGKVYKEQNRSQEGYNVFRRVLKLNPIHPEALFQLAILNLDVFSKFKIGMKYFNKAVAVSKNNKVDRSVQSRAYSAVAKTYLKQKKISKAEEFAKEAFDLDSSNISAKNILISTGATADASTADKYIIAEADALYAAKEWKAATAIYEQAYAINSKNGFAALRIANCYWEQSFVQDAIKWAELAVAADPRRVEAYIRLGEFLISQYRLVDAARVLMKARAVNKSSYEVYRGFAQIELYRKNYKGALRYSKEALKIYSNDVNAILISIKALKELGEIEKAYAYARAAMEVSRSSFELENLYTELVMRTQGLAVAKEYIEERMKATSGDLKYQVILANMYIKDQQYDKAARVALRANDLLEWEMLEGVLAYADAMGALGKLEVALDSYERAYLMKPTNADPLFKSGLMLIKNRKPKKAIKQFVRVERANPLYPDLSYQWAVATKMLAKQKNSPDLALEAIKLAKRELARDPSHFESYLLIAESYHVLGNIEKAKVEKMGAGESGYSEAYSSMVSWYKLCSKNYQKSIDKAVQPGDVYIDMARCQRLSGALDQAKASAIVAESLDKTNPRIWFETAQIYEQEGNARAALKAYQNFLLIYPNAPNKKAVENKINGLESLTEE